MLNQYFYIILFLFIISGIAVIIMILPFFISKLNFNKNKVLPYECGFDVFDSSNFNFDIRFYLVAILFIIFDLEIAFLFPWANYLRSISLFGFLSVMLFLAILTVGLIYEFSKGALEWE